jgi:hypothetical protein
MTRRCSICSWSDSRGLTKVRLADGTEVTVCGSHELMHRRAGTTYATLGEMRVQLTERRRARERRDSFMVDELAVNLVQSFSSERRAADRRG